MTPRTCQSISVIIYHSSISVDLDLRKKKRDLQFRANSCAAVDVHVHPFLMPLEIQQFVGGTVVISTCLFFCTLENFIGGSL